MIGKRMIYMDADHSGLNKFSGQEDRNFKLLLPEIQRMVKYSPSAVADRHRTKGRLLHRWSFRAQQCRLIAWV